MVVETFEIFQTNLTMRLCDVIAKPPFHLKPNLNLILFLV